MNKEVANILEELSPDKECLVHNYIVRLITKNIDLAQTLNEIREYILNHSRRLIHPFNCEEYKILDEENICRIIK